MFINLLPRGSLRRVVAGNTMNQLIGRVVSSLAIVIVSILIAQRFGPEGYGDFVKITTFVGFFFLFADFGLNAVYIQRVVSRKEISPSSPPKQWQILLGMRLAISIVLVVFALGILSFFPYGREQGYTALVRYGIALFIPVIILQAVITTTNAFFQRKLRYDLSSKAQCIGSVILLFCAVMLFRFTPVDGPILGIVSLIAGSIATSLAALFFVRQEGESIIPILSYRQAISFLKDAAPLGLALICNLIYFHSDSVVLTITRSTQEVGIYGLAYKVFELPLVLPIFFMNAVYPLLLQTKRQESKPSDTIFQKSLWFLVGSSLVISAGMWFCAPLVTRIRPDFASSIEPLRVLILGFPVFFVSALFMWVIIAKHQQRILLGIHGVAMIGNIIGNIIFIPTYGYMAAAWITVLSESFVLVTSGIFIFYSNTDVWDKRELVRR